MMHYPLAAISKSTVVTLSAILLILPLAVVGGGLLTEDQDPLRDGMVAAAVAAVMAALLICSIRRRSVSFDGATLVVKAAFWTRRTPIGELDLDGARIVNLAERTELRPMLRMSGYSLPGFRAGHYRLRNTQKAFALLTARDRVLAVPERGGTLLLLSLERPQFLLDALKESRP